MKVKTITRLQLTNPYPNPLFDGVTQKVVNLKYKWKLIMKSQFQ